MKIIKLQGIEFEEKELEKIYFEKEQKFIIKYKTIYLIRYGVNTGFYAQEVFKNYEKGIGYTKRGRFITSKAPFVNKLIGRHLFED